MSDHERARRTSFSLSSVRLGSSPVFAAIGATETAPSADDENTDR